MYFFFLTFYVLSPYKYIDLQVGQCLAYWYFPYLANILFLHEDLSSWDLLVHDA